MTGAGRRPRQVQRADVRLQRPDPGRDRRRHPCDRPWLAGAAAAAAAKLIVPILVGPQVRIGTIAASHGIDIAAPAVIDAPAARRAPQRPSNASAPGTPRR
jgi:phosphate acetyltransferase